MKLVYFGQCVIELRTCATCQISRIHSVFLLLIWEGGKGRERMNLSSGSLPKCLQQPGTMVLARHEECLSPTYVGKIQSLETPPVSSSSLYWQGTRIKELGFRPMHSLKGTPFGHGSSDYLRKFYSFLKKKMYWTTLFICKAQRHRDKEQFHKPTHTSAHT